MEGAQIKVQLSPDGMKPFENNSLRYDVLIPQGVNPETLLVPGFWAHVARTLRPFDEIRAHAEDGTWVGYYLVLAADRTWARLHLDRLLRLTTEDVSRTQAVIEDAVAQAMTEYTIGWVQSPRGWRVVRNADKAVMTDGADNKAQAQSWLDQYVRANLAVAAEAVTT